MALIFFLFFLDHLAVKEGEDSDSKGLISYSHLESIPNASKIDRGSLDDDVSGMFDKMPTNTFSGLEADKTFENIPHDVFDQIPRAVTAREERRLIKLQEKLLNERVARQNKSQLLETTSNSSREPNHQESSNKQVPKV